MAEESFHIGQQWVERLFENIQEARRTFAVPQLSIFWLLQVDCGFGA